MSGARLRFLTGSPTPPQRRTARASATFTLADTVTVCAIGGVSTTRAIEWIATAHRTASRLGATVRCTMVLEGR